jgi:hypothetical protein
MDNTLKFSAPVDIDLPEYLNSDEKWNNIIYLLFNCVQFNEMLCEIMEEEQFTLGEKSQIIHNLLMDCKELYGDYTGRDYKQLAVFKFQGIKYTVTVDGWGVNLLENPQLDLEELETFFV